MCFVSVHVHAMGWRQLAVVSSLLPPFGLQVLNWVTRFGGKCSFLLSHLSGPSLALWQTFCFSFRKLRSNLLRDWTESPAAHTSSKRGPLLLMDATCVVLHSESTDLCPSESLHLGCHFFPHLQWQQKVLYGLCEGVSHTRDQGWAFMFLFCSLKCLSPTSTPMTLPPKETQSKVPFW